MNFDIYKITSKELSPYIQYILFNFSNDPAYSGTITSFANTNICLGILKDRELYETADGVKQVQNKTGISSYLSGLYLKPHKFRADGLLDEICIDFTPLGYYSFFKFPAKEYILHQDILSEGFGKDAIYFFEQVFRIPDFQQRGVLIERFLTRRILDFRNSFIEHNLHCIYNADGQITLKELSRSLRCSERKIVRSFKSSFDLTPKDFIRIVKFRKALKTLNHFQNLSLTSICYDSGYYDQSHFIKEFKFFTENSPKIIRNTIYDVKNHVIVGIE